VHLLLTYSLFLSSYVWLILVIFLYLHLQRWAFVIPLTYGFSKKPSAYSVGVVRGCGAFFSLLLFPLFFFSASRGKAVGRAQPVGERGGGELIAFASFLYLFLCSPRLLFLACR
jgi:hypothetical protein